MGPDAAQPATASADNTRPSKLCRVICRVALIGETIVFTLISPQWQISESIVRAPRKIAATDRPSQNCLQMIPLRCRSDSLTFTAGWSAIGSESNFSRCPVIYYPDEISAATAQLSTNAAGFARVRIRPLLSAEEMDKAAAKMPPIRVPQQQ